MGWSSTPSVVAALVIFQSPSRPHELGLNVSYHGGLYGWSAEKSGGAFRTSFAGSAKMSAPSVVSAGWADRGARLSDPGSVASTRALAA
jgi:hypothetical protein